MTGVKSKPLAEGLKWWVVGSIAVLLVSLTMFVGTLVAEFVYFPEKSSPVWVTVLGVLAVLGMVAGFGGLFLILIFVGIKARREDKRQAAGLG